MQFRDRKKLSCCILTSDSYLKLAQKVEKLGKELIFEDLQYSTTTKSNDDIEYSVFIIYRQ